MKISIISILCVLAAANAVSSLTLQDAQGESYYGFYQNSIDAGNGNEELFLDDCAILEDIKKGSIKTIITTADIVNTCSKSIIRALNSSDGAVIIMGADKSVNALACSKLNTQNELFFNKHYNLPESVKNLHDYIYSAVELDIKVYTTSQKTVINNLRALILDSKYDEAVEFSKYLYRSHPDDKAGKKIIINVVNQMLKENVGYQIMNYAFKLFQNDANIVDECFPGILLRIFNEQKVKILNRQQTGILRLTKEIDSIEDRWLYSDCVNFNTTDEDVYWKFSPVWDTTLNGVVFTFQNPFYRMKLKLDMNTLGHFSNERLAWGDHRKVDSRGRFSWRLMPVGINERDQVLFRLDDTVYSSCLTLSSCVSAKLDVKGSKLSCTPDMGWIFDSGENDLFMKRATEPENVIVQRIVVN